MAMRTFRLVLGLAWAARALDDACAEGEYRYLALEGGGVRGVAYAGMVEALHDAGVLDGLRGFAGTSAGSIGAALLAAGFTAAEVAAELRATDFRAFLDSSGSRLVDLSRLFAQFGWYDSAGLGRTVDALLEKKTGVPNVTFAELHARTGKELRVTAVCVNTGEQLYFDRVRSADLAVSRAVQASAAIPFFFRPVALDDGRVYVDGSLARWLPMDAFVDRPGATLGVSVGRSGHASSVTPRARLESLPEFAAQMMAIMLASATGSLDDYAIDAQHADLVSLNVTAVDPIDFELCDEAKAFMVGVGYNDVADQLVRCGHADEARLRRPRVAPLAPCAGARDARAASPGGLAHVRDALREPVNFTKLVPPGPLVDRLVDKLVAAPLYRRLPHADVGTILLALALGAAIARLVRPRAAQQQRGRGGADLKLPIDVAALSDEQCANLSMQLTSELCKRLESRPSPTPRGGGLRSLWLRRGGIPRPNSDSRLFK